MLAKIARLAIAAPKRIVAAAALTLVAAAIFGLPVTESLSAGGFTDPGSESVRASSILTDKFDHNDVQLLIAVTADDGARSAAASAVAAEATHTLTHSPDVTNVTSLWSAPPAAAPALMSRDGKTGIIVAGLRGTDAEFAYIAQRLADQMPRDRDGVIVRAGGALTFAEANEQGERDLVKMELKFGVAMEKIRRYSNGVADGYRDTRDVVVLYGVAVDVVGRRVEPQHLGQHGLCPRQCSQIGRPGVSATQDIVDFVDHPLVDSGILRQQCQRERQSNVQTFMSGNDEGHYPVSNLSARQRLFILSFAQQQVEQVARFGVGRPHACVDDPVGHRLKRPGGPT